MKLEEHSVSTEQGEHLATIKPASRKAVERVLSADEQDQDGRSQWVWVRLSNGDLILGVYPQGDTYFECELDAP